MLSGVSLLIALVLLARKEGLFAWFELVSTFDGSASFVSLEGRTSI